MSEPVYMSIPKVSNLSGVSKDYIYGLCHRQEIQFIKVGKKYLIHFSNFMTYLENKAGEVIA